MQTLSLFPKDFTNIFNENDFENITQFFIDYEFKFIVNSKPEKSMTLIVCTVHEYRDI